VFGHPIGEYDITLSTTGPTAGTVTVTHHGAKLFGPPHGLAVNDGTDRLRNIELLRFSDVTLAAPERVVASPGSQSRLGEKAGRRLESDEFMLVDIRFGRDGTGIGKVATADNVVYNAATKLLEVKNYAAAPMRLIEVRSEKP
jgi:hypothetical protein